MEGGAGGQPSIFKILGAEGGRRAGGDEDDPYADDDRTPILILYVHWDSYNNNVNDDS